MEFKKLCGLLIIVILLLAGTPLRLWAHAFPDHSEPRVGSTVEETPNAVSIWFDGYLEPAFSTIEVYDANEKRVDKQDGRVDEKDRTLLTIGIPPLAPGTYHVFWTVVAVDGHRTEGDFKFTVEGPS